MGLNNIFVFCAHLKQVHLGKGLRNLPFQLYLRNGRDTHELVPFTGSKKGVSECTVIWSMVSIPINFPAIPADIENSAIKLLVGNKSYTNIFTKCTKTYFQKQYMTTFRLSQVLAVALLPEVLLYKNRSCNNALLLFCKIAASLKPNLFISTPRFLTLNSVCHRHTAL